MRPSPFLFGGTLQEHLSKYEFKPEYEEAVKEIREGIYVDDIHLGGETIDQTSSYKGKAVTIFREGGFCLHKWHSNVKELENSENNNEFESTFAKESCGTKPHKPKLVQLPFSTGFNLLTPIFLLPYIIMDLSIFVIAEWATLLVNIRCPRGGS